MKNPLIAITLSLFIGVFACVFFLSGGQQFFLTAFVTVCFFFSTVLMLSSLGFFDDRKGKY